MTRAVEPGAHPTRQSGHQPAHHRPGKPKRPAEKPGGPSRKIEAKRGLGHLAAADLAQLTRIVKRRLKQIQYRPHLVDARFAETRLILDG
ncbi:hypothetical protein [Streptomyces sp. NPDC001380]|uniref:hypothetical protein n=1 Tax=Streptomyces sp. NPDC001380 TaxID=3364566 RepID=UPI00368142B2